MGNEKGDVEEKKNDEYYKLSREGKTSETKPKRIMNYVTRIIFVLYG